MWNLVAIPFHFFNSSKDSTRDQFIFWTFNQTQITRLEKCKKEVFWKLSVCIWRQDCVAITLTPTIQAKAGEDKWGWHGAGLKQAASRSHTDGKLRLPMLAKPSFWGGFFFVVVAVKMIEQGKIPCPSAWIIDAWLAAWIWDCFTPVGRHTYTSPCSPGQQGLSWDLFCLTQHILSVPSPHLPLAAILGSCWRAAGSILHPSLSAGTWSWACIPPPLAALGEISAAALCLQMHHGWVQHHCCAVRHFTDLFIFSSRSCSLA